MFAKTPGFCFFKASRNMMAIFLESALTGTRNSPRVGCHFWPSLVIPPPVINFEASPFNTNTPVGLKVVTGDDPVTDFVTIDSNRRILADQMEFLKKRFRNGSRLGI